MSVVSNIWTLVEERCPELRTQVLDWLVLYKDPEILYRSLQQEYGAQGAGEDSAAADVPAATSRSCGSEPVDAPATSSRTSASVRSSSSSATGAAASSSAPTGRSGQRCRLYKVRLCENHRALAAYPFQPQVKATSPRTLEWRDPLKSKEAKHMTSLALKDLSRDDLSLPPNPSDGSVLRVDFRLTVFHVSKVMTRELTAQVKMGVIFFWNDPRMVGHTHPILPPTLWGPAVVLKNAIGGVSEDYEQFVVVDPAVGRMKRIINYEAVIAAPMDLRNFPFDVQDIVPQFVTVSHWRQADRARHGSVPSGQTYQLRPIQDSDEGDLLLMLWSGSMAEFSLEAFNVDVKTESPPGGFIVTIVSVHLYLARHFGCYIIKDVGPLVILAMCTFIVQSVNVDELAQRLKVWSAMFLAVFALLNLYGSQLPRMAILTALDKAIYLTIFVMAWIAIESWVVARLADSDRSVAEQLNYWLLGLTPLAYLLAMLYLLLRPWRALHRQVQAIKTGLENSLSETSGIFSSKGGTPPTPEARWTPTQKPAQVQQASTDYFSPRDSGSARSSPRDSSFGI